MKEHLNPALFSLKRSAIREFSALANQKKDCIKLTLGEPDFNTPDAIGQALCCSLQNGQTHYIENNGTPQLRKAISDFEKTRGIEYDPEEVIVTAGATEALYISLFGILKPGDEVIVPMPAFVLYEEQIKMCKGKVVPLYTEEDGFQIRANRLNPLVTERTKAIILNSPNNPTGVVYDRESLNAVYQIAASRNIFIVCDDVYRELVYGPSYHSFAEYRELKQKILYVQSFSKPYAMTGWRMGYLLTAREIKERLELVHQFTVVSTPSLFQSACVTALREDITSFRETYRSRRDYCVERLQKMGLPLCVPEGAFYLFPSIKRYSTDSAAFCRALIERAGVAMTPGVCFGAEGYVRISYACSQQALREGFDRLEKFLLSYKGE